MNYADRLRNVTIIGAAGKMGSGIVLLTALELARLSLSEENKEKTFVLNALDLNEKALEGLMGYLNAQVSKLAEKKFEGIKGFYPNLSEEKEIKEQYVKDVLSIVNTTSDMNSAKDSSLIFEAAVENPDLKIKIFNQLEEINTSNAWYFTNTSSIPIHLLNDKSNLEGRIVGVHFYNPPAVQKLVELIPCNETDKEILEFANTYAKNLRKVVVFSNDIAAFVGNGHFTRDILFATEKVKELTKEMSLVEAIYIMDKISREYLVRPMGIFQLCDYVGVDVCFNILKVMAEHIEGENLHSELLAKLMEIKVIGGQNSDGSAKDGIMKYEKGRPVAIFDIEKGEYVAISDFEANCKSYLGENPDKLKWKEVISSADKDAILENHFNVLATDENAGSKLAVEYVVKANEIGLNLVKDGVANSEEDVNTVMKTGFFHAYGPINNYCK